MGRYYLELSKDQMNHMLDTINDEASNPLKIAGLRAIEAGKDFCVLAPEWATFSFSFEKTQ